MSRRRQPHRIPPPISYGSENLDAEIVLHEEEGELALLLWKTIRAVRLWCELDAEERPHAFGANALQVRMRRLAALDASEDLRETLETAASILDGEDAHVEAVVTACRLLADWSRRRGSLGTALEFMQAAAFLAPTDADLVLAVGNLARARGELPRAESWYRQAISMGRRTHDWISMSGAYLGIARTLLDSASLPAARVALIRGMRAATRHSLWTERALLAHEYVRLAIASGRSAEVAKAGRTALEACGSDQAAIARLAAELGVYWVRSGHAEVGASLLHSLDRDSLDPAERLAVAAALGRASAEEGDQGGFDAAWRQAGELLREAEVATASVEPQVDLARGALLLGDRERAIEAAEGARRAAESLGRPAPREQAEEVLQAARGGTPLPARAPARGIREIRSLVAALQDARASTAAAA